MELIVGEITLGLSVRGELDQVVSESIEAVMYYVPWARLGIDNCYCTVPFSWFSKRVASAEPNNWILL